MILPGSSLFTVFLLILSMFCLGLWINTFNATGPKWRYELYCFDIAIGAFGTALILAFTLGTLGWDGFSFLDDVRNAGKHQDLDAFMAGAVFNLGNMLLVGAVSVAGMSVAFPIAGAVALAIGGTIAFATGDGGGMAFLIPGSLLLLLAALLVSQAYKTRIDVLKKRQPSVTAVKSKPAKAPSPLKGVLVAIAAGILLGLTYPLIDWARPAEIGLGPYALGVVFFTAILITTFVYNLFLMNLPLKGQPAELGAYFKGGLAQHGMGFLGGVILAAGIIASLVADRVDAPAQAGPAVGYALNHGAPLIAALCGLFVWKEFSGADSKANTLVLSTLALLAVGTLLLSAAAASPIR